jgi:4-hydroxythreonine-4-phosphate dehydrogenase
MTRPRIGITVGDPAGIGPEIVSRAIADPRIADVCDTLIFGPDPGLVVPVGQVSAAAGSAAYEAIVRAVGAALRGEIDAVATAPISKEALAAAGLPWRGHTELLAHQTGAGPVAMMFHTPRLMVALATVHLALRDVPGLLTGERLEQVIRLTARALPRFGVADPRMAVAGLNPHAGEHGLMGDEDDRVLAPAVRSCRDSGIRVDGPFPADTVFVRAARGEFDAVIACYHDQGLIPVKLLAFGKAVNVTLGLPIIRTSVDHGTAFDIAGRGVADPGSMIEAILLAARLARGR